jgi:hypothetical protein
VGTALGGWILIALGIVLAFTGKRLIWLAVGIAGFGVGWLFTLLLLPNVDPLARLLVGAVVGIAMAVVALRGLPIIGLALGAVLVGLFVGLTSSLVVLSQSKASRWSSPEKNPCFTLLRSQAHGLTLTSRVWKPGSQRLGEARPNGRTAVLGKLGLGPLKNSV